MTEIGGYAVDLSPTPEGSQDAARDRFSGVPYIRALADLSACEYVINEPGRNARRAPPRQLTLTGSMQACGRQAEYFLKSMGYTGTRSGRYCYEHVLAEISLSQVEQERLDRALARAERA